MSIENKNLMLDNERTIVLQTNDGCEFELSENVAKVSKVLSEALENDDSDKIYIKVDISESVLNDIFVKYIIELHGGNIDDLKTIKQPFQGEFKPEIQFEGRMPCFRYAKAMEEKYSTISEDDKKNKSILEEKYRKMEEDYEKMEEDYGLQAHWFYYHEHYIPKRKDREFENARREKKENFKKFIVENKTDKLRRSGAALVPTEEEINRLTEEFNIKHGDKKYKARKQERVDREFKEKLENLTIRSDEQKKFLFEIKLDDHVSMMKNLMCDIRSIGTMFPLMKAVDFLVIKPLGEVLFAFIAYYMLSTNIDDPNDISQKYLHPDELEYRIFQWEKRAAHRVAIAEEKEEKDLI